MITVNVTMRISHSQITGPIVKV